MKTIAVITRTQNRAITLERTLLNINKQIYKDFVWVIVNDGGEKHAVDEIGKRAQQYNIDVILIHNEKSAGMESASNIGIRNSQSKYLVILDDDDTWHPDFLYKTVNFLEKNHSLYHGVVTRTMIIEEDIIGNEIISKCTYPFNSKLKQISLLTLCRHNEFTNSSFLYRRDAINEIDAYQEELPILGDWHFNLKFARSYNIGVIPDYLANYHVRRASSSINYRNSITDKEREIEYSSILRNTLLRQDLINNRVDIGFLINIAHELNELERILKRGNTLWLIRNFMIKTKKWLSNQQFL